MEKLKLIEERVNSLIDKIKDVELANELKLISAHLFLEFKDLDKKNVRRIKKLEREILKLNEVIKSEKRSDRTRRG